MMNMSFLAILISLAMMLTGAGGEGQPAEAARTLIIHDVSITYNDQSVSLNPALFVGAATDGEKAVFEIGMDADGDTLFPIQLGVDETGLTALFEKSGVAVNVSATALDALSEQAAGMLSAAANEDEESAQLMSFITGEFIPAYTGLMEAIKDEAFVAEMQEKGEAIFAEIVDRGEGTPVTELIEGNEYALTEYRYTVDGAQLAALADAIYASDERLSNYAEALFKLYDMMPEESGLNGMHSFADAFEKLHMDMTLDAVEKLSDDGEVETIDGTLTMDIKSMVQTMIEAEQATAAQLEDAIGGANEPTDIDVEIPDIAPIAIDIHGVKVGDVQDAAVELDYAIEDDDMNGAVTMAMNAHSEGMDNVDMQIGMMLTEDGDPMGVLNASISVNTDEATGDANYAVTYDFGVEDVYMNYAASGVKAADGTAQNSFDFIMNAGGESYALSFYADVVADAIEDLVNGHEAAVVIDDLSEEALNALGEDPALQGALMQVMGSMMTDAQALTSEESVQQLMSLFVPVEEGYDYGDDSFEGEETGDYEYQEPEDDGELPFNQPAFTWLPDGWEQTSEEVDTAYDWVSMDFTDGDDGYLYATFYQDYDTNSVSYVVGDDGDISAVEGREITISDDGEGNVYVTLREANVYGNLNIYGAELDVETIGQIVAGIEF